MDRDLARRLNDDTRVIRQARDTAAGAFDDRGQADANARCPRDAWLPRLGAPVVVVRQRQGAVQRELILTGVVGEARGGLIGESVGWNEISPPHYSGIQLQVSGDQVDGALEAEGGFRAPSPFCSRFLKN